MNGTGDRQDETETRRPSSVSATCYLPPDSSEDGHCITCSDEALPARVLRVEQDAGLAWVAIADATAEVDITLVDDVRPGQLLLVHGGVAIAHLEEEP